MPAAEPMPDVVRVHMVGNAHIDPMWIWDWNEGMHEVLQTFRAAADRLDEDPDLRFTASSASYYQWVQETSPELFARILCHVRSGRWIVTGGQWVEPDCNLPSGESVCRQFLYGQRYLSEHLGVTATIGYNIDSFGHAGTLPQLLARAGVTAYVMMRPGQHEKDIASPLFRWRGTDGTDLPCYRIPFEYSTPGWTDDEVIRHRAAALLEQGESLGYPLMAFYGVGDHGGGPTRLAMRTIHTLSAEHGGAVAFSDPGTFFAAVSGSTGLAEPPTVAGELQWHAVGCYSVRADLKKANARAEDALVTAEKMAEMCRLLTGDAHDERTELAGAWQGTLFAQFHDALGGTCTDRANAAALRLLVSARARAERVTVRAAHRIAETIDTWVEGADVAEGIETAITGIPVPLTVFNPHSWPVRAAVSVPHPIAVATTAAGRRVPVQAIASGEVTYSRTRSLLQAEVPGFGYHRYWLHVADPDADGDAGSDADGPAPARATATGALSNGLVEVAVDGRSGALSGLGGLLSSGGVRPVILDDTSDTWSHGLDRYAGPEEEGSLRGTSLLEDGPVRSTFRSIWSFGAGRSTVTQDVSLYQGQPFVELRLTIDWHESRRLLKLVVPTTLDQPVSTAGAPYGMVVRECSGHEEPMLHWVDLSEPAAGAGRGLACTSDTAGGYDALGATLRLTLLRSPLVADHGWGWGESDPVGYPVTDQGRHSFRFRLTPHDGDAAAAQVARMADQQRVDLPIVLDTWHPGPLGPEMTALDVRSDSATVPVAKRAEDGAGTVLRLWEMAGRTAPVGLTLGSPGLDQGRTWHGTLAPHEVRTLYVPDTGEEAVREIDIPELAGSPADPEDATVSYGRAAGFAALVDRHPVLADLVPVLSAAFEMLVRTVESGGTIYVGGNGGRRAADAEHIVGELMKGMEQRRPLGAPGRRAVAEHAPAAWADEATYLGDRLEGALRAVCLTSQTGLLSAIANDNGGDLGLAQQVHGYGRPGDTFWALSTSGASRNVLLAALAARAVGMRVLALTGGAGHPLGELADVWLPVPARDVARVQELHLPVYHALCAALEERFFGSPDSAEAAPRD